MFWKNSAFGGSVNPTSLDMEEYGKAVIKAPVEATRSERNSGLNPKALLSRPGLALSLTDESKSSHEIFVPRRRRSLVPANPTSPSTRPANMLASTLRTKLDIDSTNHPNRTRSAIRVHGETMYAAH